MSWRCRSASTARSIGQLEGGKETVRLDIAMNAARALGLNLGVEARGETNS